MRRRSSLTVRLTLLFAVASTVVLLALGLLIANAVEKHFIELDLDVLRGKLQLVGETFRPGGASDDFAQRRANLESSLVGHPGLLFVIVGPGGEALFTNTRVPFPDRLFVEARSGAETQPATWTHAGRPYRGLAKAAGAEPAGATPMIVGVATDISHHWEFLAAFRRTLGLFVGGAALLIGLLAWASVRHGLAPLQAMSERAATVTAEHLDQRLPDGAVPVELEELAAALNRMLARLEESFRRLSEASADMAHELRTPLAALMTQTQVTLARDRNASEYREALASNAEELDRLARTVSEMLFIAKAENGLVVPAREHVDLAKEVDALFEFYEALAEEHGVGLRRSGERTVEGDRLMLRRALSNLLSNAIRHTPHGGDVRVLIEACSPGSVDVAVENPGAGIPPGSLPRIFDRFHRIDPSHTGAGAGLGLAITRTIVLAHGGTIAAASSGGLTRFTVRLPVNDPAT